MVLDQLQHADRYTSLHPLFEQAFQFLRTTNLLQLSTGKHDLSGDQLFALVSEDKGVPQEQAKLEAHLKYIDIQYVVTGTDRMGWKNLSECSAPSEPYVDDKDIAFYPDRTNTWLDVPAGSFTIFFPSDAHAPMATTEVVKKVVLKIAVE
ncbi:YhcH/YjgK/YiaL family protein [Nibribacter koreensis]|uniref:YhcH/YjgK/YiaL family protein n=1 Tax=Nibribacter koreensis TaxID=1084519 RepID=A0ABP8FB95_9BACT